MSVVPYVLGYLVKDNAVLLLYREKATVFSQSYALPGGKIEEGESPSKALYRELEEELGITVINALPLHVMYFQGISRPCVVFVFQVREWSGQPYNKEPHKHSHLSWSPLDQMPSSLIPRHRKIITHIKNNVWYAEKPTKE